MTKPKKPIMSEALKLKTLEETGETSREIVRTVGRLADRVVQASITSPYYSVTAVALLSAMMVRGRLIPPETSMIVTGAGLTLLGANAVSESIPILSGMSSGAYIDNEYDKQPVSPWANAEPIDRYLETIAE